MEKFKDIIFRYGFSKEDMEICKNNLRRHNADVMAGFSLILLFCSGAVAYLSPLRYYKTAYLTVFFVCAGAFLIYHNKKTDYNIKRITYYLQVIVIVSAVIYITVFIEISSSSILVMLVLALLSALFVDVPLIYVIFNIVCVGIFAFFALENKNPGIAFNDAINAFLYGLFGSAVNYYSGRDKINTGISAAKLKDTWQKLQEKQWLIETVLLNAPGENFAYREDETHSFTYISESVFKMLGYTKEEFSAKFNNSFEQMIYPPDRKKVFEQIEKILENSDTGEVTYRIETKDRGLIWVNGWGKRIVGEKGEVQYYITLLDITRQKKEELEKQAVKNALKESQKRFRIALENSDLYIWEYDLVNDRCIQPGKKGQNFYSGGIIENYPHCFYGSGQLDEKSENMYRYFTRQLKSGVPKVEGEIYAKEPNTDVWHWYKIKYELETDQNGSPIRAIGCSYDITRQKEMEENYREQMNSRLITSKNALKTANINLTQNTAVVDYGMAENNRTELFTADEVFEDITSKVPDLKAREKAKEQINRLQLIKEFEKGKSHFYLEHRFSKTNGWVETRIDLIKNPFNGEVEAYIGTFDKGKNRAFKQAFNKIVKTDYDFICVVDCVSKGYYITANSLKDPFIAFYDSYDQAVMEYAAKIKDELLNPEDYPKITSEVLLDALIERLDKGGSFEFYIKGKNPAGVDSTYRMSYGYLDIAKTQILISRVNVTNTVMLEQARQEMLSNALYAARQANVAKSEFLSGMSHEIRTPMNGIIGLASLAKEDAENPEKTKENLEKIENSAKYLLSLINDVLEMSKIESGKTVLHIKEINFNKLLQEVNQIIQPQAEKSGVHYSCNVAENVAPYYMGDKIKIQQILINILGNGVKFTQKGGSVALNITQGEVKDNKADIIFTVKDNGVGVSEEFMPHIFENFAQEYSGNTTAYGGTGLGLAISKNIAEMMGGTIEAASQKGNGACFTVKIPMEIADKNAKKTQSRQPKDTAVKTENGTDCEGGALNGKNILLADDHPINIEIGKRILEKKGMSVTVAKNGKEAVDIFANTAENYFSAILMDIRMPVMDGFEATEKIRNLNPYGKNIPIIAMSANGFEEDVLKSEANGMNSHLAKPIDPQLLYKTLDSFVGEKAKEKRFR